jgi:hypothetical protein
MNKHGKLVILSAVAALWAAPSAMADSFPLNGPHFNLTIQGAKSCKNAPLTNPNRHTIFVPLVTSGDVPPSSTNPAGNPEPEVALPNDAAIYLVPPPPGANLFAVCDGNSCNAPVDCTGAPVVTGKGPANGAVFQLPCDTFTETTGVTPCASNVTSASYSIFAEALGKPGGEAQITTCATDTSVTPNVLVCSTNSTPLLVRNTGKPKVQDVTIPLTTLTCTGGVLGTCPNVCPSGQCTFEIFASGFEGFFWDYDNLNLKNLQLRFYLNPS